MRSCIALGVALALICPLANAQANYSESFDGVGDGTNQLGGPQILVNRGWIFRNQSRPSGSGLSPYWTEFPGWGQAGSALSHGAFAAWQNNQSKISAWAILPAIPNQQAGDSFSVWTSAPTDVFGNNFATLEIRYSPSGGTGTGSGENDVGNFTQLLQSVSGMNGHPWTQRTVSLPGTGRIALRLVMGPGSTNQAFNGSFLVDSLQVGAASNPPYPLPNPGQTVHWTTAMSPIQISKNALNQNPLIVAGGTVIVDPGVVINVSSGAGLDVEGTLQISGAAGSLVDMNGPGRITIRSSGLLTATFADVTLFTDLIYGARATFADCAFSDPSNPTTFSYDSAGDIGHRVFDGNLAGARQVLSLTRCSFGQGCDVALIQGWLAARDCTFYRGGQVNVGNNPVGGEAMYVSGAAILDNVTATEAYLDLTSNHVQHRYVGNVTVTGNPAAPGIWLEGGGNYLIDSDVTLAGNMWPVHIGFNSGGILPGSVLPQTGNTLNEIADTNDSAPFDENVVWANAGIPYAITKPDTLHGQVTILPGVTVKIGAGVPFFFNSDSNGVAMPIFLGEPEAPIHFMPYTAGTQWLSLVAGGSLHFGARWDWCIFEGGEFGVAVSGFPLSIDNSVFMNNHRALYTESYFAPRKCTFQDNVFSITGERFAPVHEVRGFLSANHPANPNTFINNNGVPGPDYFTTFLPQGGLIARATHNSLEDTDSDVRNNWWGTPTGPSVASNPGGEGDRVFFGLDAGGFAVPYLTSAPTSNPPPVVRFVTQAQAVLPGEKVVVQWAARDDGAITAQRVYYSPDSNIDEQMQLLASLPPHVRSFEWTPPSIGTPPNGADQFLRVVAVDDLGQEGIADVPLKILNPSVFAGTMTPGNVGAEHHPGDEVEACATVSGFIGSSVYVALEFDNDESGQSLGSGFISGGSVCTVLDAKLPDISTDRARFRFDSAGTLNQVKSFYSPYFSIRPDALLGDAAPVVTLTSNHTGQTYAGGSVVPITWTASDDEALRSFDIRASYDGGTRWFIVARDLSPEARSYNWTLPGSDGITQVRIRVVAKDKRFQNSSAESGVFSISAGSGSRPGDTDGDGDVDLSDLGVVLSSFGLCAGNAGYAASADFDGSGCIDLSDLGVVLANYGI